MPMVIGGMSDHSQERRCMSHRTFPKSKLPPDALGHTTAFSSTL